MVEPFKNVADAFAERNLSDDKPGEDGRFTIVERGKELMHLGSLVGRGPKKLPMGSHDLASWPIVDAIQIMIRRLIRKGACVPKLGGPQRNECA